MSYSDLDQPYDALMNRTAGGTSPVSSDVSRLNNQPIAASSYNDPTVVGASADSATYNGQQGLQTSTGAVESQPLNSDGSLDDVWIRTFIRSQNWKPMERGFSIEGLKGYAEFNDVYFSGPQIAAALFTGTSTGGTFSGIAIEESTIDSATTFKTITPAATNTYKIGTSASLQFSDIYLQSSPHVSSDIRIKTDVATIRYGLEDINKLRPVEYTVIATGDRKLGLIAQEATLVIPEVVGGSEKDMYYIDYTDIIPVLIKAVQELSAQVKELEKRVT